MNLLPLFTLIATALSYSASNIVQANDQNLQSIIKTPGKFTFVDFYADWCRHCKKLAPTIDKLSELFVDQPDIQFVKINGDKDGKKMAKKYVEIGYPTLLFFYEDGRKVEFDGIRDLTSLSNFIQQLSGVKLEVEKDESKQEEKEEEVVESDGNRFVELTPTNFNDIVALKEYAVVAFVASWCKYCKDLDPTLEILANEVFSRDDNLLIGHITIDKHDDNSIDEKYDVQNLPSILFFKNGDLENPVVYKGGQKFGNLLDAINKYTGLGRDSEGNLQQDAGVINEITQLFRENLTEDELYEKLDGLTGDSVDYYKKLVGAQEFIPAELSRVENILINDISKINGITIDSLTKRANILRLLL
ncbi:Protein disulfide-isomerase C17H9.14c [Candida viswanathii]|uniref:Protein disulfide-isomerase C17H9.14c n=1 Tax=Candida viswanathii TaxID=5486 RepID=A0A367YND7_9ASCO|nr:Protein disulfide-isomerase C17H9.14c [Candida viswanathii]